MPKLQGRVLCRGQDFDHEHFISLEDIVRDLTASEGTESTLVEVTCEQTSPWSASNSVRRRQYLAWAIHVSDSTTSTVEDVVDQFEAMCLGSAQSVVELVGSSKSGRTVLLCIKSVTMPSGPNDEGLQSGSEFMDHEKQQGEELLPSQGLRWFHRRKHNRLDIRRCHANANIVMIILTVLMASLVVATALFMVTPLKIIRHQSITIYDIDRAGDSKGVHADHMDSHRSTTIKSISVSTSTGSANPVASGYVEFPTPESNEGPRHQKYLLPSNVTQFITQDSAENETFILRLDDQALMPAELVDRHEYNVQKWFADNFPILASVRNLGNHFNDSYLDYDGTDGTGPQRLLLNERYHIAHCVTAWRRYLRAVRKGRHVCPRDLDWNHLDHCTMQLESFAYRPRHLWGTGPEAEDLQDRFMELDEKDDPARTQVMLVWHTDVCF